MKVLEDIKREIRKITEFTSADIAKHFDYEKVPDKDAKQEDFYKVGFYDRGDGRYNILLISDLTDADLLTGLRMEVAENMAKSLSRMYGAEFLGDITGRSDKV